MWGTATCHLSLLTEKNPKFIEHGLNSLHAIIEDEWPQIADQIDLICSLTKDNFSPNIKRNAALLASKTFYHLGKLNEAVEYAIIAGDMFDISQRDDNFTSTIIAHVVHTYISSKQQNCETDNQTAYKAALKKIVDEVLSNLFESGNEGNFASCLCLAIEAGSLEFVKKTLSQRPSLVYNAAVITMNTVIDSKYRQSLLQLFTEFAENYPEHCNLFQLSQLYHARQDSKSIADLLFRLRSTDDKWLIAAQIAFELAENASQLFRSQVIEHLQSQQKRDSTIQILIEILTRKKLLDLYLRFLFANNKTDIHVIVALKEKLENSKMLVHSSVITAYSFMFAGTGDDNFYRNNTQWFSNGSKWAQFMTIAAVGAIHIGHLGAALQVLKPFLADATPSYAYGGGLYALGLIYANYSWDHEVFKTVMNVFQNTNHPCVVKHGACLALGLIEMGSQNIDCYRTVRDIINYSDKMPEAGEAAGYAIGMIMLGCGMASPHDENEPTDKPLIVDILEYATNCPHEKVTRGLSMALALMMYGKEEESETLVHQLQISRIPLLRESAAWVLALAYVGTASNKALKLLLHYAVSDVNPDVRRAAVIGVGFVLSRSPREVPGMVDLLAKSYHPHVRSGAALALGIACAGTGMEEAIKILDPLLGDNEKEDFVKQSAMIAMAMVLQQQSDEAVPYTKQFRQYLRGMINKKRTDLQVFGLCLAYGILNAGGRNVVISCNSLRNENSVLATVALSLFCNYFYWHPLALMLPLAFHPTAIIGLDSELQTAEWHILSKGNSRLYANPPSYKDETEIPQMASKVALSVNHGTTLREIREARVNEKEKQQQEETLHEQLEEEKNNEPQYEILDNPSRVTLNQLAGIDFSFDNRYIPVTGEVCHGFVMLRKNENPDDDE